MMDDRELSEASDAPHSPDRSGIAARALTQDEPDAGSLWNVLSASSTTESGVRFSIDLDDLFSTSDKYDYVDEEKISQHLICHVCHNPMLSPVKTSCGHTFCKGCITRTISLSGKCPVDRTRLGTPQPSEESPAQSFDLHPADRIISNMLDELRVRCPFRENGCVFETQRQFIKSHVRSECEYLAKKCPNRGCERLVIQRDWDEHLRSCEWRQVECDECKETFTWGEFQNHSSTCPAENIVCPHCETQLLRRLLVEHTSTLCPRFPIGCLHSSFGCMWLGERLLLSDHLPSCPYEAIKGFLEKQRIVNDRITRENESLKRQVAGLTVEVTGLRQQLGVVSNVQNRSEWAPRNALPENNMESGEMSPVGLSAWMEDGLFSQDEGFYGPPQSHPQLPLGGVPYPPHDHMVPPLLLQEFAIENERLSSELTAMRAQLETTELRNNVAIMNESVKVRDEIHGLRALCHQLQAQILLLLDVPRKGVGGSSGAGGPGVGSATARTDALDGLAAASNFVAAISGARGSRGARIPGMSSSAPPSPQSSNNGSTANSNHTNVLKL
ncbi:hypothetical protein M427DRAFT_63011 [Gonapodya prolifera JEL478]|uniref:RING-type domain-containing protein n=1 Tax=Gonapodya prolifera (strain JEL478) TaxID=1344416 RepID=A0A138ZZY5_GONPJ|nr:hypothetical protein M427DRAFT_63011 [Gonapodya prolifera JEL478]|eukprot:KXS10077.1 hypothetical protein M427DRAFT_63011 [Gonapodya prolifera JEL478]